MNLYLWQGIDIGGEYADAWIGVIAKTEDDALALIENDERDWISRYFAGRNIAPEVLPVRAKETPRIWVWG